jgi:hypothetical protein
MDGWRAYGETWQSSLIEERLTVKSTTNDSLTINPSVLDLHREIRCMIFTNVFGSNPPQVALVLNAKGTVDEIVNSQERDDHLSMILACRTYKEDALPVLRLHVPRWIMIGISEFPQPESRSLRSQLQQVQELSNFHNIKMSLTGDLSRISLHSLASFAELFMIKTVLRDATASIATSTEVEHCDDVVELFETLRDLGKSIAPSGKSRTSTARRAVYHAIIEVSRMSDLGLIKSMRETWTARYKGDISLKALAKAESKA